MSRLRLTSLVAGLAVVLGSAAAPLDGRFATHMVQHLLLADVGPLLVVLGLPGGRRLSRPRLALPAWTALLVAWHLTPLYDASLRSDGVHVLQHASFAAAGVALWAALVLPGPAWFTTAAKLPYVLAIWLVSLALSQVFIWSGHSYYGHYSLDDQRAGGGVMLVEGSLVMLGVVVWLLLRIFRETEERQRRLDADALS
jgi:cytochrome c oxidase assembly factor CtaG